MFTHIKRHNTYLYHLCYNPSMLVIRETERFHKWLLHLRDKQARVLIIRRVERLRQGNHGDHKNLGEISELRIKHGSGYRVYYMQLGEELVVLLAGGDKSSQVQDIDAARRLARTIREGSDERNG